MAYETPTYYGLRVNNNLSDIVDKGAALKRLTLNIGDLEIIRGAASSDGAVREDLIAISNLNVPLYKTLDRYIGDSNEYRTVLDAASGVDTALRGNLEVNGPIGGSAIRYKFVDYSVKMTGTVNGTFILNEKVASGGFNSGIVKEVGAGYIIVKNIVGDVTTGTFTGSYSGATIAMASQITTKVLNYADISTSRVSAWSTASTIPTDADPIFYGGQLKVANGGTIYVNSITWGETARPRLKKLDGVTPITGEVPTHTFTVSINGSPVKIYAMKSIPLKIRGFFKRFDGTVEFNPAISGSRVSWKILNVADSTDVQYYPEQGSTNRSLLQYRSINAAERDVEIYYHPDYITRIYLQSMGISYLPAAQLSALNLFDVSYNSIQDMPDIKTFAPALQTLSMNVNNLYLANEPTLRKFTKEVADRLPSTLTTLNMAGTFYGSVRQTNSSGTVITTGLGGASAYSVIEKACPNLTTFNVGRSSNAYFGPDDYDVDAYMPSMPTTLTGYYAYNNDFRKIPARGVKTLPNLVSFNVDGNVNLSDETFSLSSNVINNVSIGSTNLPIPDLSNRPNLTIFSAQNNRNSAGFFTNNTVDSSYKFSGCSSLTSLNMNSSYTAGFIPKFKGNSSLLSVSLYACQNLTGGRPPDVVSADGKTYALYKDTFVDTPKINFFQVLSNSLLIGKGIEPDTFKNLASLYYLQWYSYGRTGYGVEDMPLPDISSCPALQYFIMANNNFTGPVPSMATNGNIYYIDLAVNRLTGPVPNFSNRLNLRYAFLNDNKLSSFPGFEGTTNLLYFYAHNNELTGNIPMLSGASKVPNLQRLFLFNNRFTGYTAGSFAGLTRAQFIDVSRNSLYAYELNSIFDDLVINYKAAKRGGVTVNLQGQANAVGYSPSLSALTAREKEVAENIAFLRSKGWTITIG